MAGDSNNRPLTNRRVAVLTDPDRTFGTYQQSPRGQKVCLDGEEGVGMGSCARLITSASSRQILVFQATAAGRCDNLPVWRACYSFIY